MLQEKIIFIIFITFCYCDIETEVDPESQKNPIITPHIYSHMLTRRRVEHRLFVKHLLEKSDYEQNYKLLELAFDKIFENIKDNNATLHQSDYNAKNGFPQDDKLQNAVILIIENTCLAGDIMRYLPDISHRILISRQEHDWRDIFLKSIEFVMEFPQIIQEDTATSLLLFQREINQPIGTDDFSNPYYEYRTRIEEKKKPKIKLRKRLKKGPQLHTNKIEL